jgi:hypothetical protein
MNIYKFRLIYEEEDCGFVFAENYSDAAERVEMVIGNDTNDIDSLYLEYIGETNDNLVFFTKKEEDLDNIIENIDF